MTLVELYTKGARVWIPHLQKVWEGAELIENYSPSRHTLLVQADDTKETKTLNVKSESDLPHLRNPLILIGAQDLTSLSYLHEPAVLYNLQIRFCQQRDIYTYCGIVLVAINPYSELPIYDNGTIHAYRGQAMGDLDPHIFAVAEEAFTKLEREQRDQSIIVSGESGAGKTVSAKYAMRYFATVGGSSTETQIEKKVLASSPIMEAIGNAKTTRNDNSSRFGKFIELQFNIEYQIIGASMRTYLLEKSRVVFQAPDERNYHIFYQLCSARKKLPHLHLREPDYFHYLNQGNSPIIDGVSDLESFEDTVNALTLLGFTEPQQNLIFQIGAAILHLGNVEFKEAIITSENEQDQEGCQIPENNKSLEIVSELLEVDHEQLSRWLCTKKIVSMRDTILKPMTLEQAKIARDALSKHIYAELFNWIVLLVNKALETTKQRHKIIGILDIYGFETFEINSFEQFCINYANEKLQQQFNLHVFKLEQEEYIKEEIIWTMIDFYDNQPCIDLIETKLGILSLLDEECKMPKGSDGSWTEKMYLKCLQFKHFSKARFGTTAFVINHFADKVQYESSGFLEKNRDTVIEEQIVLLKRSSNDFIKRLFTHDTDKLATPGTKIKVVAAKSSYVSQTMHKKTVGSQFRDSLNLLMSTLNATTPHYVRCIKPNDTKTPFEYNPQRSVQQLRACGVLETVRISAAGFPSRWAYTEFFYRYRVLCKFNDINRNNMKLTCQKILIQYIKTSDMYQFGKTKIFFRAGQVAYLEKLRTDKLRQCCIVVQSTIRAYICRKKYLRIKNSICNIQRYGRGLLARRLAESIRRNRAAITIQRHMRGWIKRTQYRKLCQLMLSLQCRARGYLSRQNYMGMKYNAKAIIIQRFIRGWLSRKRCQKKLHDIIICQSAIRRFLARRLFKKLRVEAKSIEHVKKLNKGLENKIISLQQKIQELNKKKLEVNVYKNEVIELRNKLTTFKTLEAEHRNLNNVLVAKNDMIEKLEDTILKEKEEKMDLVHEQEKYNRDAELQRQLWSSETLKLRNEIDNMNEILLTNAKNAEEHLKARLEQEKTILVTEHDQDRTAYQRLLQEFNQLEMHCATLDKQMHNQGLHTHSRNISDVSSISTVDDNIVSTLEIPEDHGYGSVRSNSSSNTNRSKLENINWNEAFEESNPEGKQEAEYKPKVGLILQLQHKLGDTERENIRLQKRLDQFEQSPKTEKAENSARDAIRISQLEVANSKLKAQIFELSSSIKDGNGKRQLSIHLQDLQMELERRNEEIIQLKGILATQADNMKSIIKCQSKTGEYINEDGELALAYETQKAINKQLELELQDEKTKYKAYEKELLVEIDKLREDNERQQVLLSSNLSVTPQSQSEAFMHDEIGRLAAENLDLRFKNDNLNESVRKFKKQVKALSRMLRDSGLEFDGKNEDYNTIVQHNRTSNVRKKEKEYQGLFAFKHGEENLIFKHLVIELKPRTAVTLLPGLPAYIIFMAIRHTDYISDEDKVRSLLAGFLSTVKNVVKKKQKDFETIALWLSNTVKLVNLIKQYSGESVFQVNNTPKQNSQSLKNFDLHEYRQELSDMAVWIYQATIKVMQEKVQPLIVPAILEHEEIPGMGNQLSIFRRRNSTVVHSLESPDTKQKPITAILQELTNHYKMLKFYGVDFNIISQIFRQVFYFICASSMNNLLLHREWCHWSKGVQIKHNLSHLEMWTREKELDEQLIQSTLSPIIQVTYLLQANKTDEFVDSVYDMCSALTPSQICKILNLFTPVNEGEERVSPSFIKKLETKLKERPNYNEQNTLMMDTKHIFPIRMIFSPSDICLEVIEIPEVLNLPMLEKV